MGRLTLGNILEALVGSHDCGSGDEGSRTKRCLRPRIVVGKLKVGFVGQRQVQGVSREPWKS